jgi:hypothetical protein
MLTFVDGDSMALKALPRRQGAPWGQVVSPIATRGEERRKMGHRCSLFCASSHPRLWRDGWHSSACNLQRDGLCRSTLPFLGGGGQAGLHSWEVGSVRWEPEGRGHCGHRLGLGFNRLVGSFAVVVIAHWGGLLFLSFLTYLYVRHYWRPPCLPSRHALIA